MPTSVAEIVELILLGLGSGLVGGLVGLGGSIIIIPVLTLLLDKDQHLSQAAAMIVNVFVAVPALAQHHRAGAVRWGVTAKMLPAGLILVGGGVLLSNQLNSHVLARLFGVFLIYVVVTETAKLGGRRHRYTDKERPIRDSWTRVGFVGGLMGFLAGLLGIGGGPVAIPMLNRICNLPLRHAIAVTTSVMCMTAAVGAIQKNMTLHKVAENGGYLSAADSLWLAAYLSPTAMIGALLGAKLTHALPVVWVRLAFIVLAAWAGVQMLTAG